MSAGAPDARDAPATSGRRHERAALAAGIATSLLGAAGVALGVVAVASGVGPVRVGGALPLAGVTLAAGATGGLFLLLTGAVAVAVGAYSAGYERHGSTGPAQLAAVPFFVAAMLLVPLAGSATTFLAAWELMALASLVAILADHARAAVRDAARWYAVMTHLGFVAILLAFVVLGAAGHADALAVLERRAGSLSSSSRDVVFLLSFLGFGAKAGLVPLHVWLPRAHPEAPSPVSALMSAAMVATGVYGIVRIDVEVLGGGPRWWALVVVLAGATSALFGVIQASVSTDLKRLLAYSTTENMGLVTLALGSSMLLADYGERSLATVALVAALVHVVAHAAFKSLAFLGAGAVLFATGLRDLDLLGGLATRMPATTGLFFVAALGASGLPLGAGFVGEWLLVQSLIHSRPGTGTLLALVMPVAVGVVALTTGLGVAAMVKASGIAFLARPRSAEAARAHEVPAAMVAPMATLAAASAVLAVAPSALAPALGRLARELPGHPGSFPQLGLLLRLPGVAGSVSPGLLAVGVVAASGGVVALRALVGRSRRPRGTRAPLWSGGAGALTERMQYTATSFAEPLQRVFDDVLRPDVDVEVGHVEESRYLVERVRYRSRIGDVVEERVFSRVLDGVHAWASLVRRVHNGSVHRYLAIGALALVAAVAVAR
ncbi:MAG: proton-conducting transporter membrane subunit [Actinomycetota bacterium]|nr:proton-conducting transporter membrane subunit [Actinomycetota bacterium]